jgi:hypothetical protein
VEAESPARVVSRGQRFRYAVGVLAAILGATLAGFHPLVLRPNELLVGIQHNGNNDLTSYFLAARSFAANAVKQHQQPPLWSWHNLCGAPHLGNPQSAWMYPPNWGYLLVAEPSAGISWIIVLHHIWAAWGVYLLCRRWSLDRQAAAAGAMFMVCAPYWLAHVGEGHYNQICAVAWIPWAFLAYDRLRQRKRGGVALTALVLALSFFAGHAQETFYLTLVLTVAAFVDCIRLAWSEQYEKAASLLRGWVFVGLITIGVTAVDLAPIWVYTQVSVRGGGMTAQESGTGLELANLQQLFLPWSLGDAQSYQRPQRFFWETLCYFGVAPLGLALIGAAVAWRRRAVQWPLWLIVGAFAFAFGASSPFYRVCYELIPGVALFRMPSRMMFFAAVALAILAAVGVDVLLRWFSGGPNATKPRTRIARGLVALLMALGVSELAWFSHGMLRTIPLATANNSVEAMFAHLNVSRDERVLAEQALLSDREAEQRGLQKVQGYEPAPLAHLVSAIDALTPGRDPAPVLMGFERLDLASLHKPIVDLFGVRYAVASSLPAALSPGWRVIASGTRTPEFSLRGQSRTYRYYVVENETPMPRAFVVGNVRTPSPDLASPELLRQMDLRQEVLLTTDVLPKGRRAAYRPAVIREYSPARVVIEAELDQPGYVVLTDTWYPGWRAKVNGEWSRVLPANLAFRAVALPAGKHQIEMVYQPPGLLFGGLISLTTLLGLCVGVLRRPRATSDPSAGTSSPVPHN